MILCKIQIKANEWSHLAKLAKDSDKQTKSIKIKKYGVMKF